MGHLRLCDTGFLSSKDVLRARGTASAVCLLPAGSFAKQCVMTDLYKGAQVVV